LFDNIVQFGRCSSSGRASKWLVGIHFDPKKHGKSELLTRGQISQNKNIKLVGSEAYSMLFQLIGGGINWLPRGFLHLKRKKKVFLESKLQQQHHAVHYYSS